MLLTLVPLPSCSVPSTLQTHPIAIPSSWPRHLKPPLAWTRTRVALRELGLALPSSQCADRTSWLSYAIQDVTWDLTDDHIVVTFVDGTEERWPLEAASPISSQGEEPRASPMPISGGESSSSERGTGACTQDFDNSLSEERRRRSRGVSPGSDRLASEDPKPVPSSASSWSAWSLSSPPSSPRASTASISGRSTMLALRELCRELCETYEECAVYGVHAVTEGDLEHVMGMAMDPALGPSPEWGSDESSSAVRTTSEAGTEGSGRDRSPSPRPSARELIGIEKYSTDVSENKHEYKHHGQLRRSRISMATRQLTSGEHKVDAVPNEWHLPLLVVLTEIRRTLLDLYSRVLVPAIKDRLDAPTYPIWAVSNAAKWCRARAIVKSGELARNLLALLDDDGEIFDLPNSDSSESEPGSEAEYNAMDLVDEETTRMGRSTAPAHGPGARAAWHRKRIAARLSSNVMHEMVDDFELRLWCERAQQRASMLERSGEASEEWGRPQGVPSPHATATSLGPVTWIHAIGTWEATRPISGGTSHRARCPKKKEREGGSRTGLVKLKEEDEAEQVQDADHAGAIPDPPTSPPTTDPSPDEGNQVATRATIKSCSPSMVEIPDPLDEGLLPSRVPRALVTRSNDVVLGRDMAAMRRKTHESMNEVAGLQRKIKELRGFLEQETKSGEKQRADEKAPKDLGESESSSLRNVTNDPTLLTSPPATPPPTRSKRVPLRAQPLLQRTADRIVSQNVLGELDRQREDGTLSKKASGRRALEKVSATHHTSTPRKRQRDNLAVIDVVTTSSPAASKRFVPTRKRPKRSPALGPQDVSDENRSSSSKRQKLGDGKAQDTMRHPAETDADTPKPCWGLKGSTLVSSSEAQPQRPPLVHFTSLVEARASNLQNESKLTGPQDTTPSGAQRFTTEELGRFRHVPTMGAATSSEVAHHETTDVPSDRRRPHQWDPRRHFGETSENEGEGDEEHSDAEKEKWEEEEDTVVELRVPKLSEMTRDAELIDELIDVRDPIERDLFEDTPIPEWAPPRPPSTVVTALGRPRRPLPARAEMEAPGPFAVDASTSLSITAEPTPSLPSFWELISTLPERESLESENSAADRAGPQQPTIHSPMPLRPFNLITPRFSNSALGDCTHETDGCLPSASFSLSPPGPESRASSRLPPEPSNASSCLEIVTSAVAALHAHDETPGSSESPTIIEDIDG